MDASEGYGLGLRIPVWVSAFGWVGGLVCAVCLVPELVSVYSHRRTDQLTYGWLLLYALGLLASLVYFVLIGAVPAYVTGFVELVNVVLLLGMKLWFESRTDAGNPLLGAKPRAGSGDTPSIPRRWVGFSG